MQFSSKTVLFLDIVVSFLNKVVINGNSNGVTFSSGTIFKGFQTIYQNYYKLTFIKVVYC